LPSNIHTALGENIHIVVVVVVANHNGRYVPQVPGNSIFVKFANKLLDRAMVSNPRIFC
jgi:hypothetical protein